jgi:riboflavin biosynthesis pyrimidine reductase
MRVLVGEGESLADLYAVPSTPWLRVNFVTTVDGAATGEDGRSGSINNDVDLRVFEELRAQSDVVVIGAGTARVEGYRGIGKPLVLVSRSGRVPVQLRDAPAGDVLMATYAASPGLEDARAVLGADSVIVAGQHRVDLAALRAQLVRRGWDNILSEGGPHLLQSLLEEGVADELDVTVVPRVLGGDHQRITDGAPVDASLRLHTLLEDEGTLLARWLVTR